MSRATIDCISIKIDSNMYFNTYTYNLTGRRRQRRREHSGMGQALVVLAQRGVRRVSAGPHPADGGTSL